MILLAYFYDLGPNYHIGPMQVLYGKKILNHKKYLWCRQIRSSKYEGIYFRKSYTIKSYFHELRQLVIHVSIKVSSYNLCLHIQLENVHHFDDKFPHYWDAVTGHSILYFPVFNRPEVWGYWHYLLHGKRIVLYSYGRLSSVFVSH